MLQRIYDYFLSINNLSQVTTNILKNAISTNEKLARLQQQLLFLKAIQSQGEFPTTIENVSLPRFLLHPRFEDSVKFIKDYIFKKLFRHIYAEIDIEKKKANSTLASINNSIHLPVIKEAGLKAFSISQTHHKRRLQNRLLWMSDNHRNTEASTNQPSSTPETNNSECHNNFVHNKLSLISDLPNSLSNNEALLLSKGPKFAITPAMNDKTRKNIDISFSRLANELRWKEHIRRNQENDKIDQKTRQIMNIILSNILLKITSILHQDIQSLKSNSDTFSRN